MPLDRSSLRELDGVHPDLRAVVLRAADKLPAGSITVSDGLRSRAEQERHVASGASKTMNSRHLTGHAVDLLAFRDGRDAWSYPEDEHVAIFRPVAAAMKEAAAELGVTVDWGHDIWGWDAPHFQLPRRLYTDADMTSRMNPAAPHDPGRFEQIISLILSVEGGYSNRPRHEDPGGATNHGITRDTLAQWRGGTVTEHEVRSLSVDEARAIYRVLFWQPVRGDDLPPGVDYAVMDFAVHSGVRTAAWHLQGVVGTDQDYIVGPVTLAAVRAMPADELINTLMDSRFARMKRLPNWRANSTGWTRRVEAVRAGALEMVRSTTRRDNVIAMEDWPWWHFAILALVSFVGRHRNERKGHIDMNGLVSMVARILMRSLGFANGNKTVTGLISMVLGFILYGLEGVGVTPAPVDPSAASIIDVVLEFLKPFLTEGGAALSLIGVGHRIGKVEQGKA